MTYFLKRKLEKELEVLDKSLMSQYEYIVIYSLPAESSAYRQIEELKERKKIIRTILEAL